MSSAPNATALMTSKPIAMSFLISLPSTHRCAASDRPIDGTGTDKPCRRRAASRRPRLPAIVRELSRLSCWKIIASASCPCRYRFERVDQPDEHRLAISCSLVVNLAAIARPSVADEPEGCSLFHKGKRLLTTVNRRHGMSTPVLSETRHTGFDPTCGVANV